MRRILLFIVVYFLCAQGYYFFTGDFREGNVLQVGPDLPLYEPPVDLKQILSQEFTYLAKGNQTYALISQDGKYVLKLFQKHTIERSMVKNLFPPVFPWRAMQIRSDKEELQKRERIIVGYQVAYERDRENSGLIYVSFGHNPQMLKVTTVDRLGFKHIFDLSQVPFILQLKAKTTRQVLREAKDPKPIIDKLFAFYISGYERGLIDRDHNFLDNTGFLEGRVIRLDAGKLIYDPSYKNPEVYQKDLDKIRKRFKTRYGTDFQ